MSNIVKIQGAQERAAGIYYEVDCAAAPIGVGGMGRVYRGIRVEESTGVRRPVAVKFLYSDLPESMLKRVRREASIQIHNENLILMQGMVSVPATGPDGKTTMRLHVVSELLHGVMLHSLLQGVTTDTEGKEIAYAKELLQLYKADPQKFAILIVKNILSGIMALHDRGYIHRDIDPSNIMITSDHKIKLIDFGIVREIGKPETEAAGHTRTGTFIGKAAYAAPELVLGDVENQNETTDIYALGIVLFELATGHKPFTGADQDVLHAQRFEPLPLDEIADSRLRNIIAKATEKSQARRYLSAAEFRVALEQMTRKPVFDPYAHEDHTGEAGGTRIINIPLPEEESKPAAPAVAPAAEAVRAAEVPAEAPAAEVPAGPDGPFVVVNDAADSPAEVPAEQPAEAPAADAPAEEVPAGPDGPFVVVNDAADSPAEQPAEAPAADAPAEEVPAGPDAPFVVVNDAADSPAERPAEQPAAPVGPAPTLIAEPDSKQKEGGKHQRGGKKHKGQRQQSPQPGQGRPAQGPQGPQPGQGRPAQGPQGPQPGQGRPVQGPQGSQPGQGRPVQGPQGPQPVLPEVNSAQQETASPVLWIILAAAGLLLGVLIGWFA